MNYDKIQKRVTKARDKLCPGTDTFPDEGGKQKNVLPSLATLLAKITHSAVKSVRPTLFIMLFCS